METAVLHEGHHIDGVAPHSLGAGEEDLRQRPVVRLHRAQQVVRIRTGVVGGEMDAVGLRDAQVHHGAAPQTERDGEG